MSYLSPKVYQPLKLQNNTKKQSILLQILYVNIKNNLDI
tara:strand:- start:74 stop:190 length:117 start_codon:yes stop_codon:yes gene_type:complete